MKKKKGEGTYLGIHLLVLGWCVMWVVMYSWLSVSVLPPGGTEAEGEGGWFGVEQKRERYVEREIGSDEDEFLEVA
jgi:hypothetical protein